MANRKGSKTRKDSLRADELALQAFSLRLKGYDFQRIADEMGLDHRAAAYRYVDREVKRRREELAEAADKVIEQELARLDEMVSFLRPHVERGSDKHIDKMLRVMERRAKLLGLDAPTRSEVTGKDGGPIRTAHEELTEDQLKQELERRGLPTSVFNR